MQINNMDPATEVGIDKTEGNFSTFSYMLVTNCWVVRRYIVQTF